MSVLHVWIAFLLLIHTMTFWRKLATLIYPSWLNVHLHSLHPYIEGPHSVCTFWSNVNLIVTMICCFLEYTRIVRCVLLSESTPDGIRPSENLSSKGYTNRLLLISPIDDCFFRQNRFRFGTCICCQYGYLLILYSIGPCVGETCDSDKIESISLIQV